MSELVGQPRRLAAAARRPLTWRSLKRLRLNTTLLVGIVFLALILAVALFAPLLAPYDPIEQDLAAAFQGPGTPGHPLGTDNYGRDVLSRIIFSTRLDLQIGFFSVLFPFLAGSLIGVTTGYLGGKTDIIVMRIVDVLMAFPFLILVIAIMTLLGPGLRNL